MQKPDSAQVLIVDDNPANLQLLYAMLKREGYKVRPVLSGSLALEAARTDPPDLVLLDISMPEMDGYEVCRRFKADERLREIPVIFISASDETPGKVKAFSVGGVDYVTKPFQIEEVKARVATHLEIQRQRRELQESYDKLQKLEALRDGLVHMIVHDMRSPLMGVDVCLQTLEVIERGTLSERAASLLREASSTTDRLMEMVGSLLDVSRMESSTMRLDLAPTPLHSLVDGAMAKVGRLRGSRKFEVDLPGGALAVICDGNLILRVIQNLLGNAFQFTPEDATVSVSIRADEDFVRVEVSDTGPGIPAECHSLIFEKFGQVQLREGRRKFTTGLGLTFCRLAVEAHGGAIGVASELGHGSTFWFTLPLNAHSPEGDD
jgi:signal transduction histidine kinase